MSRVGHGITTLVVATMLGGCVDRDFGRLDGDHLVVRDCRGGQDFVFEPYELRATFFAVEALGEISFLRMQNGGKPLHETDAFVLEVEGADFVRERLHTPIPIDSPRIRASLSLLGSCPEGTRSVIAQAGTVTFSAYGVSAGDRIAAEFDFELRDTRTGEVVGYGFSGQLDFVVKRGRPFQPFSGP